MHIIKPAISRNIPAPQSILKANTADDSLEMVTVNLRITVGCVLDYNTFSRA